VSKADAEEVPVGAVVVKDGKVIAKAHNKVESLRDPTAHAELLAIKKALKKLNQKYLHGCTMYVSLEPCATCAYALVLVRIDKVVFLAQDERAGAVMSQYNLLDEPVFNHRVKWVYKPVEQAKLMLKEFFKRLR
jgi:tRNA(adenine34) deaminase